MTQQAINAENFDLSNCDREPIHIPGSIQPHGVLLALEPHTLKVVQVAGNTKQLLGLDHADILGRELEARIGPAAVERLRSLVAQEVAMPRPIFAFEASVLHEEEGLVAVVHLSDGVLVVELEPRTAETTGNPMALVQGMIARVQETPSAAHFLEALAREVRFATGFDRVMVYKFLPGESGAVAAEAKAAELEPYLGLHYPASDIPAQAGALYLRNWMRLIPDARYTPAPIIPALNPATGRPLDLTYSLLRSVSPLHLEYLANMGVVASMSLSLVVQGKLWGLIACHHRAPRYMAQPLRSACELFAQLASLQLTEKLASEAQGERLRMQTIHAALIEAIVQHKDLSLIHI